MDRDRAVITAEVYHLSPLEAFQMWLVRERKGLDLGQRHAALDKGTRVRDWTWDKGTRVGNWAWDRATGVWKFVNDAWGHKVQGGLRRDGRQPSD